MKAAAPSGTPVSRRAVASAAARSGATAACESAGAPRAISARRIASIAAAVDSSSASPPTAVTMATLTPRAASAVTLAPACGSADADAQPRWSPPGHSAVASSKAARSVLPACTDALMRLSKGAGTRFGPTGFFDLVRNPAAVLFLRILVVVSMVALLTTTKPLNEMHNWDNSISRFVSRMPWSWFKATHKGTALAVTALAALFRLGVFWPIVVPWAWYWIDAALMRWLHTHVIEVDIERTKVVREGQSLHLVLKKPPIADIPLKQKPLLWLSTRLKSSLKYKAGQIMYMNKAEDGMENWDDLLPAFDWHPFSIASASNEPLEFIINDAGDFTGKLVEAFTAPIPKLAYRKLLCMGPCGSNFQAALEEKHVVLVGAGTGIASVLSVLLELATQHERKLCVLNIVLSVTCEEQVRPLVNLLVDATRALQDREVLQRGSDHNPINASGGIGRAVKCMVRPRLYISRGNASHSLTAGLQGWRIVENERVRDWDALLNECCKDETNNAGGARPFVCVSGPAAVCSKVEGAAEQLDAEVDTSVEKGYELNPAHREAKKAAEKLGDALTPWSSLWAELLPWLLTCSI